MAPIPGTLTIMRRPNGEPIMREADVKYAEMYNATGSNLLDGPYELPISRVPVFRVPAYEIQIGEERRRWGLIRFLKDPQRLHNYWRSVVAEKLMMSPKAKFIASDTAIQGHDGEWRNAHRSSDPLLIYSGESGAPPQFTPPTQMEPALMQEAGMAVQDLKDVSNLHEASMGAQSTK